jgi:4-amino-4-deoxy-L-arabinose transferase-like glycosyltransferase
MQVAWATAAVFCFLRALELAEETPGRSCTRIITPWEHWFWWVAALLCVAGGILTKWTAPVFFYGTAIPLLWWRGRLRLIWGRYHLMSVVLAASLCVAWIGEAVAMTGWRPFYDTVTREAMNRLIPSHHERAHVWLQTLLHPVKVFASSLPWSAVALLALRRSFFQRWDEPGKRVLQVLHCWVWPNLLFWSLIPQHAVRYSFPLFPGIAGLAAMVCLAPLRFADRFKPTFKPVPILTGCLILWLGVKLVFVHAVIPARDFAREPRAKGEQLAGLVPPGKTLYLFRVKDEGIMFYYRRPVRRLHGPDELPSSTEPLYCILDREEWRGWINEGATEALAEMKDEQGDPIVLVKLAPRHEKTPSSEK